MKARVRLFARLADLAGTRETEGELGGGPSARAALRLLRPRLQPPIDHVRKDESGAVAVFLGVVRDNSRGRRVLHLEYDAYPEMATSVMRGIAEDAMERWPLTDVAIQHRTRRLEIGETSLLIAVSSPHRPEAFAAWHQLGQR